MMALIASNKHTTVGVNAAFLQEIKDSNVQLWATLRELREIRHNDDAIQASRVFVRHLVELRDCVALEFSLEETYGFIESAGEGFQAFGAPDATTAKMQHRDLYLQLHEFCEKVEEAQYRGTISRDLTSFIESFENFDECLRHTKSWKPNSFAAA